MKQYLPLITGTWSVVFLPW